MAHGYGHIGTRYASTGYADSSDSGWNGWLYPVLFIVLPIVACLMVLALIAINLYEYYQKKRRLEQYQYYSEQICPPIPPDLAKGLDPNRQMMDNSGYNDAQYTYNTIFGNYVPNQDKVPVRPMSGWVEPHI